MPVIGRPYAAMIKPETAFAHDFSKARIMTHTADQLQESIERMVQRGKGIPAAAAQRALLERTRLNGATQRGTAKAPLSN